MERLAGNNARGRLYDDHCIAFAAVPELFARIYSRDHAVIAATVPLLFVAAVFQVFDGTQVVTIGVLRGAGDTKSAMLANLLGYYVLGLPMGYWLAFSRKQGVVGIWIGLSIGLIIVAPILLTVWSRKKLRAATVE